ncbi:tetratricopeptide repeat protein [Salinicoccus sp. ID82-1]|uniref:Tetratricopeptide repeat protein n=1 Tax=Salinicoccus cyprini TaxID=2493691 RepID=A0A558AZ46_9STAP|nr:MULTISPECIES: tetratricopeptide repeat protein [Salinicoccus]MCG1009096.1 tetratricopeptide repeat protein [Salinicoccus sp. ID82-1]TVT29542.1 tetratricopeptide repeat protein [Salinicoccus cyprini]
MQDQIYEIIDQLRKGEYPENKLNKVVSNIGQLVDEMDLEALFILGDTLVASGLHKEAENIFVHLNSQTDHDDEVLSYLVDILITDGRLDEALSHVNEAENTPAVLLLKAEIFQQLNMSDVAIRSLLDAKALSDDPILDFALAEIYYQEGEFPDAIRHYESLIAAGYEEVNGIELNLRLAELHMNQLDLENAGRYFEMADEKFFTNDDYYRKALLEYQMQSYEAAKNLLNQVIENEPYYVNAYILLMNVHETEHDLVPAIELIESYIRQDDTEPLFFFHLGRLHFRNGATDKAIDNFARAIAIDQDYDDAYLMLFETLLKSDRTEEVSQFTEKLDTHALSGESLYLLAKIEQENENDEAALGLYQDASKLIGESIEFYTDYYAYLNEIRHPDRKDILKKLIILEPDNIDWQYEKERYDEEHDEI